MGFAMRRNCVKAKWLVVGLLVLSLATLEGCGAGKSSLARPEGSEAFQKGIDAYIYAYPLVLMDVTRRYGQKGSRTSNNQFFHGRSFEDASSRAVVAPNNDTLYSSAWLDLSTEPIIMHVPDFGSRYYLVPLMDAWTNVFASPGTRTTGNRACDFAIVGPNWKSAVPAGMTVIRSPSNMVWIAARVYSTRTPDDVVAVRALQDRMTLMPLSFYGRHYTPPPVRPDPALKMGVLPPQQVANMDAGAFFKYFADLLKTNPPAAADAPMIANLASVGIVPGRDFNFENLNPNVRNALIESVSAAQNRIRGPRVGSIVVNGWTINLKTGSYGTDYMFRAQVALNGLGANIAADSIYPATAVDSNGNPLTGAHRYVVRFPPGGTPPANAFWSLTLYNYRRFFADNPLNRYAIHSVDNLAYNADGWLDLYIQVDSPGPSKETNWLPAPQENFTLTMRIYWPKPEALSGTWKPPFVHRVN